MTTWTEIVAAAVVHSSAAALTHFGVTLEPAPAVQVAPAAPAAAERVVARSPRAPEKLVSCPRPRTGAAAERV
jgi:hypothetical protein